MTPALSPEAELEAWHAEPCEVCGGAGELEEDEHPDFWSGSSPSPAPVMVPCPYCAPPEGGVS